MNINLKSTFFNPCNLISVGKKTYTFPSLRRMKQSVLFDKQKVEIVALRSQRLFSWVFLLTLTINIILTLCISLINIHKLTAQKKNTSYGNQQWIQYYNTTKLNNNLLWLNDMGYRWKDGFEESTQYIMRTALGYSKNPNLRVSAGLAQLGFYSTNKLSKIEFRPYQELILKNKIGNYKFGHRYRIEERFFNTVTNGEVQTPNTFNFRFRYGVSVNILSIKLSSEKTDRKFILNVGDEIFINAGKKIIYNVFDQNRIMISPAIQLNKNLTFALMWNNQFAGTTKPATYKHTNVIWFKIKHKIDLTKEQ